MTQSNRSTSRTALTLSAVNATAAVVHFARPEVFDPLIPRWLPGKRRTWTHASGVAEIATSVLMSNARTRRWGGLLTAVLYVAVWPGNMQMVANFRGKPWPMQAAAWARLPLQLWLIKQAWSVATDDSE